MVGRAPLAVGPQLVEAGPRVRHVKVDHGHEEVHDTAIQPVDGILAMPGAVRSGPFVLWRISRTVHPPRRRGDQQMRLHQQGLAHRILEQVGQVGARPVLPHPWRSGAVGGTPRHRAGLAKVRCRREAARVEVQPIHILSLHQMPHNLFEVGLHLSQVCLSRWPVLAPRRRQLESGMQLQPFPMRRGDGIGQRIAPRVDAIHQRRPGFQWRRVQGPGWRPHLEEDRIEVGATRPQHDRVDPGPHAVGIAVSPLRGGDPNAPEFLRDLGDRLVRRHHPHRPPTEASREHYGENDESRQRGLVQKSHRFLSWLDPVLCLGAIAGELAPELVGVVAPLQAPVDAPGVGRLGVLAIEGGDQDTYAGVSLPQIRLDPTHQKVSPRFNEVAPPHLLLAGQDVNEIPFSSLCQTAIEVPVYRAIDILGRRKMSP